MNLTEWIKYNYTNYNLSNRDEEWVLFIKDHRRYILNSSQIHQLTPTEHELYRYRPMEYLISIRVSPDLTWIFLWLNQLDSCQNFNNVKEVYVPNHDYLLELYSSYLSYRANLNRSNL